MNFVLVLAGVALIALPGWTAALGRRLPPREWALLSAMSLRTGLLALRAGLVVTAAPTVARAAGVHDIADACHQLLGPIAPGGLLTVGPALAGLALVQARIVRVRRRSRRTVRAMHVEAWLGQHHSRDDHELVILPTASSLAYAVGGSPPQVVVSDGVASALAPGELAAVISHERCHLRHSHQRHLELALVTEAALAPSRAARRSAVSLRLALERWADEDAADEAGRACVRRALEKVVVTMLEAVPAFTTAETLRARLDALGAAPRPTPRRDRLVTAAPAMTLMLTVGVALLTGGMPIYHGVLGVVDVCPL